MTIRQGPDCSNPNARSKRASEDDNDEGHPATIEVYSGLYVNENAEIIEGSDDSVFAEKVNNQFTIILIKLFILLTYCLFKILDTRRCALHFPTQFCHCHHNSWPDTHAHGSCCRALHFSQKEK